MVQPLKGCSSCCSLTPVDKICPGRSFALQTLFLSIACTLAVLDIEAPAGEKLEPEFRGSAVRFAVFCFSGYSKLRRFTDRSVPLVSIDIPSLSNA